LVPDYSAMDAREIVVRNHEFESWDDYAAFAAEAKSSVSLVGRFRKAAVDSGWLGGTANPRVEVHARRVFRFALMRRPGRLMKLLASPAVRAYSNYVWPLRYRALADNNKILFIRISDIVYIWDDKEWKYLFSPGTIVSRYGDLEAFSNYCRRDEKNKSIRLHFKEGVPWHQTELFDVFYRSRFQRERGLTIRGCRNMAELHDLYKAKYDTLFREVEKNGIDYTGYGRGIAPLYVHISKHGEFIWTSDGQHRLAMCMALGLEEIPCRVYARHREWQRRRDALSDDLAVGRPVDPVLLAHPDMQDIVRAHDDQNSRGGRAPHAGAARAGEHSPERFRAGRIWPAAT
jgi:hypothetical protein